MSEPTRQFQSTDYSPRHAECFAARYDDGLRAIKSRKVHEFLGEVRGRRVFDIGCGIGYFAALCTDLGAWAVASDFAESMITTTQQRSAGKFPIVRASAEAPPFRSGSFDAVLALDVIEHLYHPDQMLENVHRVLTNTGRLIITTDRVGFQLGGIPFKETLRRSAWLTRFYRRHSRYARYVTPLCTHVCEYDMHALIALVERAGFRLERFDTYPNRARYGLRGKLIEWVGRGPLRKYKWDYAIYAFVKKP